jgi:hypothetical protein
VNYEQQPPTGYDNQQSYGGYGAPAQFMQDPMANMAMQYGQSLAGQGKEYVHKNVCTNIKARRKQILCGSNNM